MRKGKDKNKNSAKTRRADPSDTVIKTKDSFTTTVDLEVCEDEIIVEVKSLRLYDEETGPFAIKISFFDRTVLTAIIKTIGAKDEIKDTTMVIGTIRYNPSEYKTMCMFADYPLVVFIQPFNSISTAPDASSTTKMLPEVSHRSISDATNVYYCNIDILPIFLNDNDKQELVIIKRMEPLYIPSSLYCKSWDCLPLLTLKLVVNRNPVFIQHYKQLKEANWMKLTLVGVYNAVTPYDTELEYTAVSKICCEANTELVLFNKGYEAHKRFDSLSFYPNWESLRVDNDAFTHGNEKFVCNLENLQNEEFINLQHYIMKDLPCNTVIWGSFHRTLMLKSCEEWFSNHIKTYKWPIEIHMQNQNGGYSFMGFMHLFRLLYAGETRVCVAVPLTWINASSMMQECGCDLLLIPNKVPESSTNTQRPTTANKTATESNATIANSTDTNFQWQFSGGDDSNAFVLVEVTLGRPLKEISIPPIISTKEIDKMLRELEKKRPVNRECTSRGQLETSWQNTVRIAANALRRVPYYGTTEFCNFMRQLSETRTRVEVTTSAWLEASVYINNHFPIERYLHSEECFEELLLMSHACLMKSAVETLVAPERYQADIATLLAARHARQMQDMEHAMELYVQLVVLNFRDANNWRELSTCLKEIDRDWATICLNKAVVLDPRHPLTLLSKGSMLFEEDPESAEPFFLALLALYPFWTTVWVIASSYYHERGLYNMADEILRIIECCADSVKEQSGYPREWERELGDWWDSTPILPNMSRFLDAADLLLRLRAIPLAEVCLARAVAENGESAPYYHLVALCCRLRGEFEDALCHLRVGCEKFGDSGYLRSLEGECYHALGNTKAAMQAFENAGHLSSPYCVLLSLSGRDPQRARPVLIDMVCQQPSAYAWMAFAENWIKKRGIQRDPSLPGDHMSVETCAQACAIQALKWDRRAGRAWDFLAKRTHIPLRHSFNVKMARSCGYEPSSQTLLSKRASKETKCKYMGAVIKECCCELCQYVKM